MLESVLFEKRLGRNGAPIQKHLKLLEYIFNDPFSEAPVVSIPEISNETIIY